MKANKENIVTDILIELEKGTSYSECLTVICGKFRISDRTFDKYWKESNERHLETQRATQLALKEQSIASEKERLKMAILDKNEALEILTKIAKAEPNKADDGTIIPNSIRTVDQIGAIKTISDLQGWNEPIKTDNTIKDHRLNDLSFDQLLKLAHDNTRTDNTGS